MRIVIGDLVKRALMGDIDVIVQGCNCFCRMKRGIAKTIADTFPEAVAADNATVSGDKKKLGTCSIGVHSQSGHTITIVNAYTQYHWNGDGEEILIDYDALRSCLKIVKACFSNKRIGLPLVGAGLARGDWSVIERIIVEELNGLEVTIVHFQA